MDFLSDLASEAEGSVQVEMTIEAVLIGIAMLGWGALKIYNAWRNGKGDRRGNGKSAHAAREEKLLADILASNRILEGHLQTQAIHMEHLVTEQRGTTDAIKDLEGESKVLNTRIETMLQMGPRT